MQAIKLILFAIIMAYLGSFLISKVYVSSSSERFVLNAKMKGYAQKYNYHFKVFEEPDHKGMKCGTVYYKKGTKGHFYETFCLHRGKNKLVLINQDIIK